MAGTEQQFTEGSRGVHRERSYAIRHLLTFQVAAFAAIVLATCSPLPPGKPAGLLVLTADDSGREVSIRVGEEFVVRLASNPTTGYRWLLAASDERVVEAQGEAVFVRDPAPDDMVGVGGVGSWHFRGTRIGHQALSLEYRRVWEDPSLRARTVTYSITVR